MTVNKANQRANLKCLLSDCLKLFLQLYVFFMMHLSHTSMVPHHKPLGELVVGLRLCPDVCDALFFERFKC